MRQLKVVQSGQLHQGSVNFLESTSSGLLVTGSADKTVKLFDMRKGLNAPLLKMQATDAVFCGDILDDRLALVGTGDGNLLAFDLKGNGECLYGYGADEAGAIHCMKIAPDKRSVITCGDSG